MSKQTIKYWLYGVLALAVLAFLAVLAVSPPVADRLTIVSQRDGTAAMHGYTVEVARTLDQQRRGLMHRDSLPSGHGMLFIYPREQEIAMWMRNTRIPLDMLFIDAYGAIRHIHANAKPHDETPIASPGPALAVLELNGGEAAARDIRKGDAVRHPAFKAR